MDLLFEFIFDLVFELSEEAVKSKRLSKWIRYPLLILISLLYLFVILIILIIGIAMLKEMTIFGILFIVIDIAMIYFTIKKFKNEYLNKKNDIEEKEE